MNHPDDDLEVEIEILSGSSPRSPGRPSSAARDAASLPPPPIENTSLDLPISVVEDLPLEDPPVRSLPRLRRPRARRADPAPAGPPRAPLSRRDVLAISLTLVAIAEGVALLLLSR